MFIFINFLLIFILFATPSFSSDFPEQPSIFSIFWNNARTILFDQKSNVSKDGAVLPETAKVPAKPGKTLSKKERKILAAENARIEAEEIRQREIELKAQEERKAELSLSIADELLSLPTEKDSAALDTAAQQNIASSSNPLPQHDVTVKSKAKTKQKPSRRQAIEKANVTKVVEEKKEEEKPKKYVPAPIADLSRIGQGRRVITQKKTAAPTQLLTKEPLADLSATGQRSPLVAPEKTTIGTQLVIEHPLVVKRKAETSNPDVYEDAHIAQELENKSEQRAPSENELLQKELMLAFFNEIDILEKQIISFSIKRNREKQEETLFLSNEYMNLIGEIINKFKIIKTDCEIKEKVFKDALENLHKEFKIHAESFRKHSAVYIPIIRATEEKRTLEESSDRSYMLFSEISSDTDNYNSTLKNINNNLKLILTRLNVFYEIKQTKRL